MGDGAWDGFKARKGMEGLVVAELCTEPGVEAWVGMVRRHWELS